MEELAHLFHEYMYDGDDFAHAVFRGSTQIGRSLVREESIPADPSVEVLDWELATHIVAEARSVAVSLCPCREHAKLVGEGCDAPTRTCLTFGGAADALGAGGDRRADLERGGAGRPADGEGRGAGADRGQREARRQLPVQLLRLLLRDDAVDPAQGDHRRHRLVELGRPGRPRDVPRLQEVRPRVPRSGGHDGRQPGPGKRKYWAIVDPEACLGCGVCDEVCLFGAHSMQPRDHRVFTPDNTFDRMVAMAVERGKLGDLLVDTLDGAGPHALARVLQVIERSRPVTALLRGRAAGIGLPARAARRRPRRGAAAAPRRPPSSPVAPRPLRPSATGPARPSPWGPSASSRRCPWSCRLPSPWAWPPSPRGGSSPVVVLR